MSKILVISPDEIKKEMAGPAMRSFEIAKHLKKDHKVTLVHRPMDLERLISENDIIICQQLALTQYPALRTCKKALVFDLYNLSIFECLEIAIHEPKPFQVLFGEYQPLLGIYSEILKSGDFFICANEKQRDFWLGMLMALGRIDIRLYKDERNLKNIIDIVPFGIPNEEPYHTHNVLRGVYPGIKKEDKVIIWGGGVYDWLDPLTAIRAVHKIVANRPEVKLFFMGVKNPYRPLPKMRLAQEAIELSRELGIYNKNVFFNDWVAYEERQNYLLEAGIGISTHHKNSEAYYSSRTRVLDYIWAGLPIIISEGDGFSEIVKRYQLGLVVKDNDVDAVAQGILRLLDDTEFYHNCKKNIKHISASFFWDKAIAPLNHYCHFPAIAQDRPQNMVTNKGLGFYVSQMPFYISYFGYRALAIKLTKRILNRIRYLINNYPKNVLVVIFSCFVLCITFIAILLNDAIIMPVYRMDKND
jgi:glycosyltransferase involved in cell wall biosynthesis